MTRNDFLNDVLEACAYFHWEVFGAYRHYDIVAITNHFIQVSVIHFDQKEQWGEVMDFQNNEELIDEMLDRL